MDKADVQIDHYLYPGDGQLTAFAPVSAALLLWSDFDEHRFQEELRALWSTLPKEQQWWADNMDLA